MKPWFALPAVAVALSGCAPGESLRVATAFTAHVMCSQTLVAGRDPQAIFRDYVLRTRGPNLLSSVLRYRIDRQRGEVVSTVAGHYESRARYAEGRGCTMATGSAPPAPIDLSGAAPFAADPLSARQGLVAAGDPRIEAAVARAFVEPPSGPHLGVKAVVVVHDGRIIAERYAPGFGPDVRMQSWSMAKSVTNALIGVLVRESRLRLDGPAPVAAWRDPADPHHPITVDELLRQTSGQPFGISGRGFNPSTRMLFFEPDTAAYAAAAAFRTPPGAAWSYSDGNYAILSGIIRDATGGSAASVARFSRNELFAPLGMTTALQEFDAAGAPMGASYVWASPRDWARFGQLYVDDGVANGRRVLPEGWADYSARPTPQARLGYGAGFWTSRGDTASAVRQRAAGAPPDAFWANGDFGQRILISPAERLVVVRLGFSQDGDGQTSVLQTARLAGEVVAALHHPR